jgi:hypothetical protein
MKERFDNAYFRMCAAAGPLQEWWRRVPRPVTDMNPPDYLRREQTIHIGQTFLRGLPAPEAYPRLTMVADVMLRHNQHENEMLYRVPMRLIEAYRAEWGKTPRAEAVKGYLARQERGFATPAELALLAYEEGEPTALIARDSVVLGPWCEWMPPRYVYRLTDDVAYPPGPQARAQHWLPHDELTRRGPADDYETLHWIPRQGELELYVLQLTAPSVMLWEAVEQAHSLAADFMEFCSRELRAGNVLPMHPHDHFNPPLLTPASVWLCYVMWKCHGQVWVDKEGGWVEKCDAQATM